MTNAEYRNESDHKNTLLSGSDEMSKHQ